MGEIEKSTIYGNRTMGQKVKTENPFRVSDIFQFFVQPIIMERSLKKKLAVIQWTTLQSTNNLLPIDKESNLDPVL